MISCATFDNIYNIYRNNINNIFKYEEEEYEEEEFEDSNPNWIGGLESYVHVKNNPLVVANEEQKKQIDEVWPFMYREWEGKKIMPTKTLKMSCENGWRKRYEYLKWNGKKKMKVDGVPSAGSIYWKEDGFESHLSLMKNQGINCTQPMTQKELQNFIRREANTINVRTFSY
jgi:hypothetical protein